MPETENQPGPEIDRKAVHHAEDTARQALREVLAQHDQPHATRGQSVLASASPPKPDTDALLNGLLTAILDSGAAWAFSYLAQVRAGLMAAQAPAPIPAGAYPEQDEPLAG